MSKTSGEPIINEVFLSWYMFYHALGYANDQRKRYSGVSHDTTLPCRVDNKKRDDHNDCLWGFNIEGEENE